MNRIILIFLSIILLSSCSLKQNEYYKEFKEEQKIEEEIENTDDTEEKITESSTEVNEQANIYLPYISLEESE